MAPATRRRRRIAPKDSEAGQGLVEYALILIMVAIICIAALAFFGTAVSGYLSTVGTSV